MKSPTEIESSAKKLIIVSIILLFILAMTVYKIVNYSNRSDIAEQKEEAMEDINAAKDQARRNYENKIKNIKGENK